MTALATEDRALVMFPRFSTIAVPPTPAALLRLAVSWRPHVVVPQSQLLPKVDPVVSHSGE